MAADRKPEARNQAIREIQLNADSIDAMALAIEVMTEQLRESLNASTSSTVAGDEMWAGVATLLGMIRLQASGIGASGEAIETA